MIPELRDYCAKTTALTKYLEFLRRVEQLFECRMAFLRKRRQGPWTVSICVRRQTAAAEARAF